MDFYRRQLHVKRMESEMLMPNVILAEPVQTFVSFWRNQHYCTVLPNLSYAIARRLRENGMYV